LSYYPLNLSLTDTVVAPLFGNQLVGHPHIFDFSSANPIVSQYDAADFERFQQLVFSELASTGKNWGVGRYLEERRLLLTPYPQMQAEGRFFHVGLDIVVPQGWPLYAPLSCVVVEADFDTGLGNYGGYVKLRHELGGVIFYSLYGHLDTRHVVKAGERLEAGQQLGNIGADQSSGGWFTHTHLQVITEAAEVAGRGLQGYVTAADLGEIEALFPSPYPLFKCR